MKKFVVIFLFLLFQVEAWAQIPMPECLLNEMSWDSCRCNAWRNQPSDNRKLIDLNTGEEFIPVSWEISTEFNSVGNLIFLSVSFSDIRTEHFLRCLEDSNYIVGKRWKKSGKVISERRCNLKSPGKKFLKLWNEVMTKVASYCY